MTPEITTLSNPAACPEPGRGAPAAGPVRRSSAEGGRQLRPIGSDADALRSAIASLLQAAAQTNHPVMEPAPSPAAAGGRAEGNPGMGAGEESACQSVTPQLLAYVAHLFWLRQQLELGFFPASGLTAEEAQGLLLLQGEIQKLESARRCPHCGAPTKSITHCDACKRPLPSTSSAHGPLPVGPSPAQRGWAGRGIVRR